PRIPGLGGLSKLHLRHHKAAARDTIPPVWKPASRLALEDRFVRQSLTSFSRGPVGMRILLDPRRLVVDVDPDSGRITTGTRIGDVPLGPDASSSLGFYSHELGRYAFEKAWRASAVQNINALAQPQGGKP